MANGDGILACLKEEREKFARSDKDRMQKLINELVALGVYPESTPAMEKHGYSHLTMVESWGADWHQYRGDLSCPKCGADLRDHETGPPFKREIGIYDQFRDRTVAWQCPDCDHQWPRVFPQVKPKTDVEHLEEFLEQRDA
jgi:hypothetical protein